MSARAARLGALKTGDSTKILSPKQSIGKVYRSKFMLGVVSWMGLRKEMRLVSMGESCSSQKAEFRELLEYADGG